MLAQTLVEVDVIFFVNLILVSEPQSLLSVDLIPFENCLLYLFSLWLGLFSFLDFQILSLFCGLCLNWFLDFNLLLVM